MADTRLQTDTDPAGSPISVRRATPEDAEAISSVLLAAFAEYRPLYTDGGFAATTPTPEQVALRIAEGPVWLALSDNTLVGTVSAVSKGAGLYVRGMAVLPVARGRHVGDLLLQCVENFASANAQSHLFLSTTPFLARAIRLYERWGYLPTREGPHDLFGTPLFTMVKDLDETHDRSNHQDTKHTKNAPR
jgi:putative acetyltransferase